jgi:hypothetical protein
MNNGPRFEMLVVPNLPWPLPSTALGMLFQRGEPKNEFFRMADVGFFLSTSHLCNLPPFDKGGRRGIFFKGEATNYLSKFDG